MGGNSHLLFKKKFQVWLKWHLLLTAPVNYSFRTTLFFIRTMFIRTLRLRFAPKFKKLNVWAKIRTSSVSTKFYAFLYTKKECNVIAREGLESIPEKTLFSSKRLLILALAAVPQERSGDCCISYNYDFLLN